MSQEELSEKVGFKSYTTIQKWESGDSEPNMATLRKLSSIFNVSISDLVETDLSMPPEEIHVMAAHHDSDEWTDEELTEIENFKKYVLSKREK